MKNKAKFIKYCTAEVELARLYLENDPENETQRDRLAYWSARMGDFETAEEYATSQMCRDLIAGMQV